MNLNDLLAKQGIDAKEVIALRHRPSEPELRKVLPWLAAERPAVYNAYQQTQGEKLQASMQRASHLASFIGHEAGKAIFIGLYTIVGTQRVTFRELGRLAAWAELRPLGMRGGGQADETVSWFDLQPTDFYQEWKGRLIVKWPPPERSWWRRAHQNDIRVVAILEESALVPRKPEWESMVLAWEQLAVMPTSWKAALAEWRGIYFIHDTSDGKGYVGSAYGQENILQRWLQYADTGHGGNVLLRKRDPRGFRFSILQRVSPDMDSTDVIGLEKSWKERLHTRSPEGLNEN